VKRDRNGEDEGPQRRQFRNNTKETGKISRKERGSEERAKQMLQERHE
jgi:hypothetical protein